MHIYQTHNRAFDLYHRMDKIKGKTDTYLLEGRMDLVANLKMYAFN